jgi:hypothetical protein
MPASKSIVRGTALLLAVCARGLGAMIEPVGGRCEGRRVLAGFDRLGLADDRARGAAAGRRALGHAVLSTSFIASRAAAASPRALGASPGRTVGSP